MTPVSDNLRLWSEWLAVPTGQDAGQTPKRVWTQWQREKSPPMLGMKPQLSGHPAHSLDILLTEVLGSPNYCSTGIQEDVSVMA